MYKIDGRLVDPNDSKIDSILESAYQKKVRPLCMCKGEPGIPMYLSHISESGRYLIKRMPWSGEAHEKDCGSWGVSDGISGRGDILNNGYDFDGKRVKLKFDFPLVKYSKPDGDEDPKETPEEKEDGEESEDPSITANTERKLTLRAFLDALWEDAGLNRRQPGEAQMDWAVVHSRLMQAIDGKVVRRHPLADSLYIPPPLEAEGSEEHGPSLRRRLINIAAKSTPSRRSCIIIVAEMATNPTPAPSGNYRVHLGPGSEISLGMEAELHDAFMKRYGKERGVADEITGSHQIVAATVSATREGTANIEEMCAIIVNPNWIPFSTIYDEELFEAMDKENRSYERPLRYDRRRSVPMPAALLTDVGANPVLMCIILSGEAPSPFGLIPPKEFEHWIWDMNPDNTKMPALPARSSGGSAALESKPQAVSAG